MERGLGIGAIALAGAMLAGSPAVAAEPSPSPPPVAGGETVTVMAGRPEYDRSGYFKFHFGEGYRKLWTAKFQAHVLDLHTYAGGLTPVRQVGSMQSIGLALKGANGKAYTFRTLDKDPTKILPEAWRDSFPATVFQDQTTASHPAGAFIVPVLAEAAGVPHTEPAIVVMPDDPALGKFQATFGGKVGSIDEYPTPAADGHAGFDGATEILSTDELWKRWKNGEVHVDAEALLRARILDLFLGDWDRHNGQWRWMSLPGHEGLVALPEDRDQAFANYSGVMMAVVRSVNPRLLAWHPNYDNMSGLILQGREVDDWLLTSLERAAFEQMGRDVQQRLTDAVIEEAVRQMPPEWFAIDGESLIRDLKKRRDLLPQAAVSFYGRLAKWVDVQGTEQADVALLTRAADGSAVLELSLAGDEGKPGTPYFRRRFQPSETDEVRVYLYGGANRFTATGPPGPIKFRVAGGPGLDRFDDSKSGGTRFYDVEKSEVVKGSGTKVVTREWTRIPYKKDEAQWMEKQDWGSMTLFQPLLWWEPDPGVVLSAGVTRFGYGFRKQPYATMQNLTLQYKTNRTAFAASYTGDFRWAHPDLTTLVEVSADGAKNYNFYGIGNDTAKLEDNVAEAHQKVFSIFPSLVAFENQKRTLAFALGPEVKYSETGAAEGTFISTDQPYGFGNFGQVGAKLKVHVDTRGRQLVALSGGVPAGARRSDTGLRIQAEGRVYPKAWDIQETLTIAWGETTGYWQPVSWLTLAARAGGQKNWGKYPWYESAFIGGSDSVRGYDRNRFAGDSSAYGNVQAMFSLFNLNLVLPLRFGVMGLADTGRVWVAGETSDTWHSSAGGGIFIRLLTTDLLAHAFLAHGHEGNGFYVNIGFGI